MADCPNCGTEVRPEWSLCPHCKVNMRAYLGSTRRLRAPDGPGARRTVGRSSGPCPAPAASVAPAPAPAGAGTPTVCPHCGAALPSPDTQVLPAVRRPRLGDVAGRPHAATPLEPVPRRCPGRCLRPAPRRHRPGGSGGDRCCRHVRAGGERGRRSVSDGDGGGDPEHVGRHSCRRRAEHGPGGRERDEGRERFGERDSVRERDRGGRQDPRPLHPERRRGPREPAQNAGPTGRLRRPRRPSRRAPPARSGPSPGPAKAPT